MTSPVAPALSALDKARLASAERRASGVPIERLDPIQKARRNPKSLRLAINGKCFDCVGAGADPNPRGAIRECAIQSCTLHPVRPYQASDEDADGVSPAEPQEEPAP